ncbi:sensor histidine kinase [Roseospira goensis]|uniref:histidine kinase n=1 Tax=Roseospira goensis TaxID=391922 RepID=A0A7W6S2T3_9PROT|nr:ATP-binding protein [Roseospira goensis]MBB4287154.1 signal transduction histidine kinase [Roseospira goensis]
MGKASGQDAEGRRADPDGGRWRGGFRLGSRALAVCLVLALLMVISALWLHVLDRDAQRRRAAIDSWLALEGQIVDTAARATQAWLDERINEDGISVQQAEREALRLFIDPIQLGADGDAWIYNRNYVVFDESLDFPRSYFGKEIAEVFALQARYGAAHYEELVAAVQNAGSGTTWYIWLPEKGREYAAYTSVRVHDEAWTIGLSTPQAQILEVFRVPQTFRHEVLGAIIISLLLIGLATALWFSHRADAHRLAVLRDSHAQLERAVAERTRRLESMNQDLSRSNQDLEQFAYAASHDLQAPLRTISGFLGLLQTRYGPRLDDEAREFITYSIDGAKRLSRQIHALLEYSRLTTAERSVTAVSLTRIVTGAVANLRGPIEETGARVQVPDDLPMVAVDPAQATVLFQNLIGNAIKYRHPAREPDVWIEVVQVGVRWRISVVDNGIGIAPEYQGRIFGVFQRLHGPADYEGTGIGLALCKRIVERHGGTLTVTSDGRSGAAFTFSLAMPDGMETDAEGAAGTDAAPAAES